MPSLAAGFAVSAGGVVGAGCEHPARASISPNMHTRRIVELLLPSALPSSGAPGRQSGRRYAVLQVPRLRVNNGLISRVAGQRRRWLACAVVMLAGACAPDRTPPDLD